MLDDSYCVYLNFPIDMPQLVSEINEYVQFKMDNFHYSPTKQFRINFQDSVAKKINHTNIITKTATNKIIRVLLFFI